MKRFLIAAACAVALVVAGCAKKQETSAGPSRAESAKAVAPATAGRVPPNFRASDPAPEPSTRTGWARTIVHEKTGMEMVFIPAGEFMMGSPLGEKLRSEDEGPPHRVRITHPFYIGKYLVTQAEWKKATGDDPSSFKGGDRMPVNNVSWLDCEKFAKAAGDGLALPTEAEWEYACRAGTITPFNVGITISANLANYKGMFAYPPGVTGAYRKKPTEVGSFQPNAWGLYDMHGNLYEYCRDWYGKDYYAKSPTDDPKGPQKGESRVLRGGSWDSRPVDCRSAKRARSAPDNSADTAGCRMVLELN